MRADPTILRVRVALLLSLCAPALAQDARRAMLEADWLDATTLRSMVARVGPAPYAAALVEERRAALAAAAPAGTRLVAYLDRGFALRAGRPGAVEIRQLNGAPFVWSGAREAAAPRDTSVAFEAAELEFELRGLDTSRRYRLGLSWWDYDSDQRTQSVQLVRAGTVESLLGATRLPSWRARQEAPETRLFEIDPGADLVLRLRAEGGAGAVLGELWLYEERSSDGDGR